MGAGTFDNRIIQNTIINNDCGVTLLDSENNTIYHNSFINNTIQRSGAANNGVLWHNLDNEGNYWSDYSGKDLDGDGIGDTELPHQGVDNYPLIDPWEPIPGDLNSDDQVDIFDVVALASVYGCEEEDDAWRPEADLAPPWGIIDIFDLVTCTCYYGRLYP